MPSSRDRSNPGTSTRSRTERREDRLVARNGVVRSVSGAKMEKKFLSHLESTFRAEVLNEMV